MKKLLFVIALLMLSPAAFANGLSDGELAQKAVSLLGAIDEGNVAECDREKFREGLRAVRELAQRLSSPIVGMEFVPIQKGSFEMGDIARDRGSEERPVHTVVITKDFEMQKTEVTQRQWTAVMGWNLSRFQNPGHPVEQVSWEDVQLFIAKLNQRKDGYAYRLPTEAEWEYAARGGTKTRYSFGDDQRLLDQYGWHSENSGDTPHSVAQLKPNAFGLYDMHGNVWEWVSDWYGDYSPGTVMDPQGPNTGVARVIRGGSWNCGAREYLQSATRLVSRPGNRNNEVGFRLARTRNH